MKKFLLILGMLTCLLGLAACGNSDDEGLNLPAITEEEAAKTAEALIEQMNQIVTGGMTDYYADDASTKAILDNWAAALEELGEYESFAGCELKTTDDSVTIIASIVGSERDGKVTIVMESENGQLALSSVTTTVTKSMGELMKNAGLNTLLGMGTVFIVLILIMWIISAFKIIYNIQNKPKKEEEKATDGVIAQIEENEELSDDTELVAVIAAAIAASEGATSTDGFVVRSIRRANTNKWQRA